MEVNSLRASSTAASCNGNLWKPKFNVSLRLKHKVALPEKRLSKKDGAVFTAILDKEGEDSSEG